ncbi:uncharacterized protein BXZ73DRAFT_53092, partial [Epithele typhae]|uniref:uncharacterized protein n=1 Tax=Epithele typhae TaxID=378194 RepID=UPI0020085DD9
PFNKASADTILRTVDRVDFRVRRSILAEASPFFEDMFSLPQPIAPIDANGNGANAIPIVHVSEDSKTLRMLLLLCYPVNKPDLVSLEEIVPVLEGAQKYVMEWPVTLLSRMLLALVPAHPLRVWAVACRTGLQDVARCAAKEIKKLSPDHASTSPFFEPALRKMVESLGGNVFDRVTAGQFFRLRDYLRSPSKYTEFCLSHPTSQAIQQKAVVVPQKLSQPSLVAVGPAFPPHDIIVESAEGVQFKAHQLALAQNSPILSARVASVLSKHHTQQGSDIDPSSSLPCLALDIPSQTLSPLLLLCYGENVDMGLEESVTVIVEADKLKMTRISVLAKKRYSDGWAVRRPVSAYFEAISQGADPGIVQDTLRKSVEGSWLETSYSYSANMERTPALAYCRLLEYHEACANAACASILAARSQFLPDTTTLGSPDVAPALHPATSAPWLSALDRTTLGSPDVDGSPSALRPATSAWMRERLTLAHTEISRNTRAPGGSFDDLSVGALLRALDRSAHPGCYGIDYSELASAESLRDPSSRNQRRCFQSKSMLSQRSMALSFTIFSCQVPLPVT